MMEESNFKKQLVISNVNFNYGEDSSVEVTFDVKNNNEVPISFLNIQFQGVNELGNVIDTRVEQIIWRGYLEVGETLSFKEVFYDFNSNQSYVPIINAM